MVGMLAPCCCWRGALSNLGCICCGGHTAHGTTLAGLAVRRRANAWKHERERIPRLMNPRNLRDWASSSIQNQKILAVL